MILIVVAWLLILAIALYQSLHGLFSAVIMAFLTTICAVFALGYYEWLGPAFLYSTQPAYADALSLVLHFVIPLLILRTVFDKLIIGNAPLGGWADRASAGLLGLYIGTVMVGILAIALQMLPYGSSVLGYEPFDRSLQRTNRIYCDEFALGVFKSTASLASDQSFDTVHDDLLLELFCARNTAGLNGRVDAPPDALTIPAAFKPDKKWEQVIDHKTLPSDPCRPSVKSDVLIVQARVSNKARSDRKGDDWYRLPVTHFRLVTKSGVSLYPLGAIAPHEGKWALSDRADDKSGKAKVADLYLLGKYNGQPYHEVLLVYLLPRPDIGDTDFGNTGDMSPAEMEDARAERAIMYAPEYMVFRRTAKMIVPVVTPAILPELPKSTTQPKTPLR